MYMWYMYVCIYVCIHIYIPGAVYSFSVSPNLVLQFESKIFAYDASPGYYFGCPVALWNRLAFIGATGTDNGFTDAGGGQKHCMIIIT